jgi:hypothetical protein
MLTCDRAGGDANGISELADAAPHIATDQAADEQSSCVTTGRELARGEYFILEPEVAQGVLDQLDHGSFRHGFPLLGAALPMAGPRASRRLASSTWFAVPSSIVPPIRSI